MARYESFTFRYGTSSEDGRWPVYRLQTNRESNLSATRDGIEAVCWACITGGGLTNFERRPSEISQDGPPASDASAPRQAYPDGCLAVVVSLARQCSERIVSPMAMTENIEGRRRAVTMSWMRRGVQTILECPFSQDPMGRGGSGWTNLTAVISSVDKAKKAATTATCAESADARIPRALISTRDSRK